MANKEPKALYSEKGQSLLSWLQLNAPNNTVSNKTLADALGTKPIAISSVSRALARRGVVEVVDTDEGKGVCLTDAGRVADPYATEQPAED